MNLTAWITRAQLRRSLFVFGALALGHAIASATTLAQSNEGIPGLIITAPSQGRGSPQPPAQAQPEPKAKAKAQSTAKPEAKPQREASAEKIEKGSRTSGQGIVVLVNDEPITAYEVEQRATFLAVSGGGSAIGDKARDHLKQLAQSDTVNQRLRSILEETVRDNPGKTREQVLAVFEERKKSYVQSLQRQALENAKAAFIPGFKKKALEELIEERLKLQEAKRLNIGVGEDEATRVFKGIAERNKMTEQQFADHLKGQGIDALTMKGRLHAQAVWRDVIRRKFGHQISVTARDVDRVVASGGSESEEQVELNLQKITLPMPGKIDQKTMAHRLDEAEQLRRKFPGCKGTPALAKSMPNAVFEDMGFRKAGTLTEPTRSLLLNAKDGEMLPGTLAQSGVELYAVCSRRTVKADEQKRQQAQEELAQKEIEVLARRHLRDLRQDAMIEYR